VSFERTRSCINIPLLPYLSDDEKGIEEFIASAAEKGADYVIVDLPNSRGKARKRITTFLTDLTQT
jgi:DNA repair photolyase